VPASSFSTVIITGRLKRAAGSHPNTRLVARHMPVTIAIILKSRRNASAKGSGSGSPTHHAISEGVLNNANNASEAPSAASTTDSASSCCINRPRLAPMAWRMDSSRSRMALRTCTMPMMFRQITNSGSVARVCSHVRMIVRSAASRLPIG